MIKTKKGSDSADCHYNIIYLSISDKFMSDKNDYMKYNFR